MSPALGLSSFLSLRHLLPDAETTRDELDTASLVCHLVLVVNQLTSPELMLQSWEIEDEGRKFLELNMLENQDSLCGACKLYSQSRSLSI